MCILFSLTRILLKGNGYAGFGSDARPKKKKLGGIGGILLFSFLAAYMLAIASVSAWALFDLLEPAGLSAMMIGLFLSTGVALVFFFGILYVMGVFYFSSDVEKLLPLPIRPEQIIGAKFLVTMFYEYLFLLVLVAPTLTVYGIRSGASFPFYASLLIVFILLPVIPLAVASLIIMLIMRFTPFARNKDRFNMVSMLLALGLSLGFTFGMQSMVNMNRFDLSSLIMTGAGNIARITASVFPGTAFAAAALGDAGTLRGLSSMALLFLCVAAAVILVIVAGKLLYFKGVIGITGSNAARRRLSSGELGRMGKSGSPFVSYVAKDIRILLRTPIYFVNCILLNFMWPLFIAMPLLTGSGGISLAQIRQMIYPLLFEGERSGLPLSLAIAFAGATFIAAINGIAASALSREGRLLYIMKMIPMSYTRQIGAKITVALIFSTIGCLMITPFVILLLQPPIWFLLLLAAILPGALLLPILLGILFDLMWPKLNWESEQKAVKQNMNVLYTMLAAVFFSGLFCGPVLLFKLSFGVTAVLVTIFPLALALGIAVLVRRFAPNLIRSILA